MSVASTPPPLRFHHSVVSRLSGGLLRVDFKVVLDYFGTIKTATTYDPDKWSVYHSCNQKSGVLSMYLSSESHARRSQACSVHVEIMAGSREQCGHMSFSHFFRAPRVPWRMPIEDIISRLHANPDSYYILMITIHDAPELAAQGIVMVARQLPQLRDEFSDELIDLLGAGDVIRPGFRYETLTATDSDERVYEEERVGKQPDNKDAELPVLGKRRRVPSGHMERHREFSEQIDEEEEEEEISGEEEIEFGDLMEVYDGDDESDDQWMGEIDEDEYGRMRKMFEEEEE